MADVSAKLRTGHRRDGSAHCSDHWLRLAVCPSHHPVAAERPKINVTTHPTAEWIARQIIGVPLE